MHNHHKHDMETCKNYIKQYCFWYVHDFASYIRKAFELNFTKHMHDYFGKGIFVNESNNKIDAVLTEANLTENDILQCKNVQMFKKKLEEHQEKFEVYEKLVKELVKLKQKLGSTIFNSSTPIDDV